MSKRNEGEWLVSLFCLRRMGEYLSGPVAATMQRKALLHG